VNSFLLAGEGVSCTQATVSRDLVDLGARLVVDVDAHRGVGPARPSRSPIVMADLDVTIGG